MPDRNPYLVLGVSRGASGSDIREAYRTLAFRYHPDVAGDVDAGPFIEVQHAYEVLRDPASRREWDQAHSPYSDRRHATRFSEPMVDLTAAPYSEARQARAVAPDLAVEAPMSTSLLETVLDAFDMLSAGFVHEGSHHSADLFFDLVLTPEEAARGGRFSFRVPLRRRDGTLVEPDLHVLVPPGTHDGQRARLPLDHFGVSQTQVTVTIRVE